MIELRGIETDRADSADVDSRSQIYVYKERDIELKAGDEVLVLIKHRPEQKREDYGVALRLTHNDEPGENEMVIQYGDRLFVAQKLPEFI